MDLPIAPIDLRLSPFFCRSMLLLKLFQLFAERSFLLLSFRHHPIQHICRLLASKNLNRFTIANSNKRLRYSLLKRTQIAFQNGKFGRTTIQHLINHKFQQAFRKIHVHIQIIECHLRFDHPEFCKMSPGFTFLCSKRWTKRVDFPVSHRHRLPI